MSAVARFDGPWSAFVLPRPVVLAAIVVAHMAVLLILHRQLQNVPVLPQNEPREVVAMLIPAAAPASVAPSRSPDPTPKIQPAPQPKPAPAKPAPSTIAPKPKSLPAPDAPAVAASAPPAPAAPAVAPAPAPAVPAASASAAAATAPASPPAPPAPKQVSMVQYLQAPQPQYPAASRRMGEHGKVVLRVLINDRGLPEQVQIQQSSGFPRLDDSAREAVHRFTFKPYREDGKPVAVYALIPINFNLQ